MKKILSVILFIALAGCTGPYASELQSDKRGGLQLYCTMAQTKFAVGQELPPPNVKIHNGTLADADLVGPTSTVIECMLVQPDKKAVFMYIGMPTGRNPWDMPSRRLKAGETIGLKADGIWYYNEQTGYEPYIFRQKGTYRFSCKYEKLNSNTVTITVGNVSTEQAEEKMKTAYAFLLRKVQADGIHLIASVNDKNTGLIRDIIQANELRLKVESYYNLERGPDLCHYSKSSKQTVAILDVTKRNENKYYVSYYIGPEGGASKEIRIENKNGQWTVMNDDGMWSVK